MSVNVCVHNYVCVCVHVAIMCGCRSLKVEINITVGGVIDIRYIKLKTASSCGSEIYCACIVQSFMKKVIKTYIYTYRQHTWSMHAIISTSIVITLETLPYNIILRALSCNL